MPSSICACNRQRAVDIWTFPDHTFELGSDHDSSALYAISNASSKKFSFIELIVTVQDAFAMCINGILRFVSQEFQLSCIAESPAVDIVSLSLLAITLSMKTPIALFAYENGMSSFFNLVINKCESALYSGISSS